MSQISHRAGPVIGVDVGGTKIAVGQIVGSEVRSGSERPTDVSTPDALLDGVEAAVAEVSEKSDPPAAIGVGVPSQVEFASGHVISSNNVPLEGIPLREELARRFGAPVWVDNDANCAALAESHAPVGGPVANLVMLTLGTGVGGGIVIDGRIFRGASGLGAELGHVVIEAEGPECPGRCPSRGCLEAFCSGTALARDATELGAARPRGRLGRVVAERGAATSHDAVEAARAGDRDALELLERLGTRLGIGLAGIVNSFEPEQIVIGGGLSRAADLFLAPARAEAAARALPAIFERVSISLARAGADAGVIGAGLLAAQELPAGDTAGSEAIEGGT